MESREPASRGRKQGGLRGEPGRGRWTDGKGRDRWMDGKDRGTWAHGEFWAAWEMSADGQLRWQPSSGKGKACDGNALVSTVSLFPQITHQENHTERTGGRKRKERECPGAASVTSGSNPAALALAPPRPQPRPERSPGPLAPTLRPLRLRGCGLALTCAPARHNHALRGPAAGTWLSPSAPPTRALPAPRAPPRPAPLWEFFCRRRGLGPRPAPVGTGACAQGPARRSLVVWRVPSPCVSPVSEIVFFLFIETEKSNIFKGTLFFTPLLPKAHANSGFHIELFAWRSCGEGRQET